MPVKFKKGDRVIVLKETAFDASNRVRKGDIGTVLEDDTSIPYVEFENNNCWAMLEDSLQLHQFDSAVEIKVPQMPFRFRQKNGVPGVTYKVYTGPNCKPVVEVDNSSNNERFCTYSFEDVRRYVQDGSWIVLENESLADPVGYAAKEVQMLLRERVDAKAHCARLDAELANAEEHRRSIGKRLIEAQRALDMANHAAAGVEFNQQ
jgi:hypothetical protein